MSDAFSSLIGVIGTLLGGALGTFGGGWLANRNARIQEDFRLLRELQERKANAYSNFWVALADWERASKLYNAYFSPTDAKETGEKLKAMLDEKETQIEMRFAELLFEMPASADKAAEELSSFFGPGLYGSEIKRFSEVKARLRRELKADMSAIASAKSIIEYHKNSSQGETQ